MSRLFLAFLLAASLTGNAIAAPLFFSLFIGKTPEPVLQEIAKVPAADLEQQRPVSLAALPINPVDQSEEVIAGLDERLDVLMLRDFASNGI